MNGEPKLPLLPGFVIHRPKENYHLPQCWLRLNGTNLLAEKKHADNNWLINDSKILCFNAYFRQKLAETDKFQIRRVKILFYMGDGTIQVVEPRTDNSGIPQGCIVKRQRVPCDLPDHDEHLTQWDLNVQKQVKIFDRIYTITDCDRFTRTYLNRCGIEVPAPIQTPKDPLHLAREQMEIARRAESAKPRPPKEENRLEKFLKFDNCCLKFDAYWDDRDSQSGDIHYLTVYYYLSDDTIQINEMPKNGKPVTLYRRLKLPKKTDDVLMINQRSNATVLNVLGRDFMHARCIPDRLGIGKPNIEYYTDADLKIGQTLNLFGRTVVLTDCDKFTREYYQKKYGIEEFVPIERPKETRWLSSYTERPIPPYNGWGSFADSEANCHSIQPKPPQRDMRKFLTLANCNLRFKAQMISGVDDDSDREFIITYYLSDDTISVFENAKRNFSSSGDFLKRTKCYLPNQNKFSSNPPEPYASQMLYIGAIVHLNGFEFRLADADEYTLNYMETHESQYPMANISSIMSKVKGAIEPIYKDFIGKYLGVVPLSEKGSTMPETIQICHDTTAFALRELLDDKITEHEIVTFLRYFDARKQMKQSTRQLYDRTTVQSMVQMAIAHKLWDDFDAIKELIYDWDPENHNGFMKPAKLRTIIKGCRLPIKDFLINEMFNVLNRNGNGDIDVNDFLYFIDSRRCKAPPIQPINPYCDDDKKAFNVSRRPELVDWSAFIAELGLEEILKQQTE